MIIMESNWEKPEIINLKGLRRSSNVYYDDIENPVNTPRDRKNMQIQDRTLVRKKENVT